ncbi:hypothetical protein Nmel_000480 [Mimus melanotis]
MASKTPVGFIGLGNMGNPMAKNLVKHGYPVIVYDVFPEACKEFQDVVCSRTMASKTPVGFIGLGNMGNPMAKNLVKHGYPVIVYDVFPEACKEFQDVGAQVTESPADVAERADRIITMLPSSPHAKEVYTGANGILKKVKKGSLLIDSSTIDPAVSKELAKAVEKMGAVFMDAPVSGDGPACQLSSAVFFI